MQSLDKSIGMSINYVNRKMQRYLSANLKKYNITTEQWSVLLQILENDGINQKHLARKFNKGQATLVRILDILERKELAIRQKSPEDRRFYLIYGTSEGRKLKEEVYPFVESLFQNIIKGIAQDQLDLFIGILNKIDENIPAEEQKI